MLGMKGRGIRVVWRADQAASSSSWFAVVCADKYMKKKCKEVNRPNRKECWCCRDRKAAAGMPFLAIEHNGLPPKEQEAHHKYLGAKSGTNKKWTRRDSGRRWEKE